MRRFALLLAPLLAGATATQASAAWLQCAAHGQDTNGILMVFSTVADVGAVPPPRLQALQARLVDYVGKATPDATAVTAHCNTFADQLQAEPAYMNALNAAARRYGWEHVLVVAPEAWLPQSSVLDDSMRP